MRINSGQLDNGYYENLNAPAVWILHTPKMSKIQMKRTSMEASLQEVEFQLMDGLQVNVTRPTKSLHALSLFIFTANFASQQHLHCSFT